jgi:subfamily B ATP-binding cassette protein MsbA
MKIYLRLLGFARPLGRLAVPYFIFSLLSTVFGLLTFGLIIPLLSLLFSTAQASPDRVSGNSDIEKWARELLTSLQEEHGSQKTLLYVCIFIIGTSFLTNFFRYMAVRIIEFLRTRVVYNIREAAYDKLLKLQVGYLNNERRGDIISRMTNDVQEIESVIAHNFSVILKDPFTLVGYLIALFWMSPQLTLFSLVFLPVSGGIIAFFIRKLRENASQSQTALGAILGIIDETLGGIKVIKGFNSEPFMRKKFQTENKKYATAVKKMAYRRELTPHFSEFTGVTLAGILLYYGGTLVLAHRSTLSPEEFITYIALFTQITKPIKDLSQVFTNLQRGLVAGNRILEVMDVDVEILSKPTATQLNTFNKEICFEDVSFGYGEKSVLKQISFTIPKGKTIALVGTTGSGKSTIADLIPRFYDVKSGAISIDGINIKDYSLESLRSQMGIVTQESILFNDTIFNNIAFGKPDATLEEVKRAAEIANAHEFIMQKEDEYQFVIGDRGTKLSGGQRQRLSIARAVLKNPPILILDEATSNLDNISEKLVQEALIRLMQNRTVLVIAHRLTTIRHADEILVIQHGEIVERGNHESLLENNNGYYKKLSLHS